MKLMKHIDIGVKIMIIGIIFNILETWFFGWNTTPTNNYEYYCDIISYVLIYIGLWFFLYPLYHIYFSVCHWFDKMKD